MNQVLLVDDLPEALAMLEAASNDNAPVLRLLNSQVSIPENAAAGDIVGAKASASVCVSVHNAALLTV